MVRQAHHERVYDAGQSPGLAVIAAGVNAPLTSKFAVPGGAWWNPLNRNRPLNNSDCSVGGPAGLIEARNN